jgi:hypothetical protein
MAGALDGNSSSESSPSNSSSKLTLGFSVPVALDASSIATSWVSGSDLTISVCETAVDSSSATVDSGVIECGISAISSFVSVLFSMDTVYAGHIAARKRDAYASVIPQSRKVVATL